MTAGRTPRSPKRIETETEEELIGRSGGGGKLSRSETVTVRLDPKLRYLATLAARKQRRTLSSFIEWAVEEALKRVQIVEAPDPKTVIDEGENLWDVDEPDRFVKLAQHFPELLTFEEQSLWKSIREDPDLVVVTVDKSTGAKTVVHIEIKRLRSQWKMLAQPRDSKLR